MPTEAAVRTADWGSVRSQLRRLREPALFGLVGLLNTAIDFTVFLLLVGAGLHPLAANTVSFSLGAANSYVLNGRFTFAVAGRQARSGRTILRFVGVTLCTLALSHASVWAGLALALLPGAAKAISVLVTFAFGFVMSKLLVFGIPTARPAAPP